MAENFHSCIRRSDLYFQRFAFGNGYLCDVYTYMSIYVVSIQYTCFMYHWHAVDDSRRHRHHLPNNSSPHHFRFVWHRNIPSAHLITAGGGSLGCPLSCNENHGHHRHRTHNPNPAKQYFIELMGKTATTSAGWPLPRPGYFVSILWGLAYHVCLLFDRIYQQDGLITGTVVQRIHFIWKCMNWYE